MWVRFVNESKRFSIYRKTCHLCYLWESSNEKLFSSYLNVSPMVLLTRTDRSNTCCKYEIIRATAIVRTCITYCKNNTLRTCIKYVPATRLACIFKKLPLSVACNICNSRKYDRMSARNYAS